MEKRRIEDRQKVDLLPFHTYDHHMVADGFAVCCGQFRADVRFLVASDVYWTLHHRDN
jgi:hypothetical protein